MSHLESGSGFPLSRKQQLQIAAIGNFNWQFDCLDMKQSNITENSENVRPNSLIAMDQFQF